MLGLLAEEKMQDRLLSLLLQIGAFGAHLNLNLIAHWRNELAMDD